MADHAKILKYHHAVGVAIGDSYTQPGTYIARIEANETTALANEGISGQSLVQLEARFEADVLAANPDYCIIQGGINDVYYAASDPNTTMRAALQAMVDAAIADGVVPVIATVPMWSGNVGNWTQDREGWVASYNSWIASYASTNGYLLYDMYARLCGTGNFILPQYDSGDGTHPNTAGYNAIGDDYSALLTPAAVTNPVIKVALWDNVNTGQITGRRSFENIYDEMLRAYSVGDTGVLLHFNESPFIDTFAPPKTITGTGSPALETTIKKFGAGSVLLDGIDDSIDITDNTDLNFLLTEAFTIDFWIYPVSLSGYPCIFGRSSEDSLQGGGTDHYMYHNPSNGLLWAGPNGLTGTAEWNTGLVLTADTWQHIELCLDVANGFFRIFKDGVQINTLAATSMVNGTSGDFRIGHPYNIGRLNAYIDEFRITKGVCQHTENFTPPTTEYTPSAAQEAAAPTPVWTALPASSILKPYSIRIVENLGAGESGIVSYKLAANGGADGSLLTQRLLRFQSDITITDTTQSVKIYPTFPAAPAADMSCGAIATLEAEMSAGSGGCNLIDGGLVR